MAAKVSKVSKRDQNQLHAAVDEIIAANPECATALASLFTSILGAATAVSVSGKKGGKKSTKVSADNDDIDDIDDLDADDDDGDNGDDDDDDDNGDDDDDVEDLENVKPKRGRGKAAKEEPEEEAEELEELTADAIMEFFNNLPAEVETHERIEGTTGIKELESMIDDFGFDAAGVLKDAKAKSVGEKRAAFKNFLSGIHLTLDAIMEFEVDSVIEAIEEISGNAVEVKGRGKTKELNAATELFTAAVAAE